MTQWRADDSVTWPVKGKLSAVDRLLLAMVALDWRHEKYLVLECSERRGRRLYLPYIRTRLVRLQRMGMVIKKPA